MCSIINSACTHPDLSNQLNIPEDDQVDIPNTFARHVPVYEHTKVIETFKKSMDFVVDSLLLFRSSWTKLDLDVFQTIAFAAKRWFQKYIVTDHHVQTFALLPILFYS